MARWSLALLVLIPLLSGCLGSDDDPAPPAENEDSQTDTPAGPTAPGAPAAPNAPRRTTDGIPSAPSANLRVEDLPFPVDVSDPKAVRVPGGGTVLLRVISDVTFRLEDSQLEGDSNSPWWIMVYARNETRPEAEVCVDTPGSLRFWSSLIHGNRVDIESIPAGEYLVLVDNPEGEAFRLGFQGANPANAESNFTAVRWRNHTTTLHQTEVTGSSPDGLNYEGTFSLQIPLPSTALVYTRFSTVASLTLSNGFADSTLHAGEGTPCSVASRTASGLQGSQTRVTVRPDAYVASALPVTWAGTYKALLPQGTIHETTALVITYSDLPMYRPYWTP